MSRPCLSNRLMPRMWKKCLVLVLLVCPYCVKSEASIPVVGNVTVILDQQLELLWEPQNLANEDIRWCYFKYYASSSSTGKQLISWDNRGGQTAGEEKDIWQFTSEQQPCLGGIKKLNATEGDTGFYEIGIIINVPDGTKEISSPRAHVSVIRAAVLGSSMKIGNTHFIFYGPPKPASEPPHITAGTVQLSAALKWDDPAGDITIEKVISGQPEIVKSCEKTSECSAETNVKAGQDVSFRFTIKPYVQGSEPIVLTQHVSVESAAANTAAIALGIVFAIVVLLLVALILWLFKPWKRQNFRETLENLRTSNSNSKKSEEKNLLDQQSVEIKQLTEENQQLTANNNNITEEKKQLTSQLKEQTADADRTIKQLETEKTRLQKEIEELETEKVGLQKELKEQKDATANAESEADSEKVHYDGQLKKQDAMIEHLNTEKENLKEEVENLKAQLENTKGDEKQTLQNLLRRFPKMFTAKTLDNWNEIGTIYIRKWSEEIENQRKTIEQLEREKTRLQKEVEKQKADAEKTLVKQKADADKTKSALDNKILNLQKQIDDKQSEINRLTQEIKKKEPQDKYTVRNDDKRQTTPESADYPTSDPYTKQDENEAKLKENASQPQDQTSGAAGDHATIPSSADTNEDDKNEAKESEVKHRGRYGQRRL